MVVGGAGAEAGTGAANGGILSPERESLDRLNNRSNQLQRLKLSRKLNGYGYAKAVSPTASSLRCRVS